MIHIFKYKDSFYGVQLNNESLLERNVIKKLIKNGVVCIIVNKLEDLLEIDIFDNVVMTPKIMTLENLILNS